MTLNSMEPERDDYIFRGWAETPDADSPEYALGGVYNKDQDVTLYAVWEAECDHQISWAVVTKPTISAAGKLAGTCSICGKQKEIILPVLNSDDYDYTVRRESTCQKTGLARYTWVETNGQSFSFDAPIAKIDHHYVSTVNSPTCIDNGSTTYTCDMCGDTFTERIPVTEPTGDEGWTTEKPAGVPDDMIFTKTQYSYSDYETRTNSSSSLPGWTLKSTTSRWVQNGSGSVEYVQSWPAGFSRDHRLFGAYNRTPVSASETSTSKVTINSNNISGYLYYHWCRGIYNDGPINRGTRPEWTSEFNAFHAFYSTTNPGGLTASPDGDGSRIYGNADVCRDSHWYYNVPVYTQTYTTYEKVYTYTFERWTEWSDWSDTEYTESPTRKVRTRTLYKYDADRDSRHIWGAPDYSWDDETGTLTAYYVCELNIEHEKTEVLENLNVLRLPAGTIEIEEEAFAGIAADVVIIPEGCTEIGNRAFADCPNLIYVRLPDSVTSISEDAFTGTKVSN